MSVGSRLAHLTSVAGSARFNNKRSHQEVHSAIALSSMVRKWILRYASALKHVARDLWSPSPYHHHICHAKTKKVPKGIHLSTYRVCPITVNNYQQEPSEHNASSTRWCPECKISVGLSFAGEKNWTQHVDSAAHKTNVRQAAAIPTKKISSFFTKTVTPTASCPTFRCLKTSVRTRKMAAPATYTGIAISNLVRSMAVTAGAWQSLIVAWGNPTIFTGPSVFPVLTVPLTGIGESSTQPMLQRTDFAINRSLHCSVFFCLVAFMQLAAAIVSARGAALRYVLFCHICEMLKVLNLSIKIFGYGGP
ncbi:uncharacterized protein LACBIDRAFT_332175 [Laccaria bicolor S238N-H82]|uniref:Predicted protein n=1 Tax=Laccaria bicolor (strain S238N-H82 / ATCC MYA-4686) TaxID=486041 RepID=B0DRU5_LACBS|nr:uncharacterized protein LACBIDRAFT_332175 [Laccaria bicolor S238N-H82]EDR02591.1 predicted protein [Laccaria bicolor S238N-H82]|eukprot:XP_001886635.1 predicted protein [Laccaria bicolor S238N-H82]